MAPYLAGGRGHLIIFHFLTEGQAYVQFPGGRQELLTAGDIVVVPHGDTHLLGNGLHARPVDSVQTFARNLTEGLKVARFGGGGRVTKFVCGYMVCDPRLSESVLSGLPKMLVVHVANEPSAEWLRNSIRFSVEQVGGENAGSGLVVAKLSELLFVETLRRYINELPDDQIGWLAGVRDPVIGKALALLHKDPARNWSISILVKNLGLSRTRLTERFRHFLGESPMAYLNRWRMKLAAEILQSSEDSVAAVAFAVGYSSEAAFNRAFKREFDCPPAQFRRNRKSQPAQKSKRAARAAAR
jgi:AraC-like DNA-binding protein